jgi:hypothetical protein
MKRRKVRCDNEELLLAQRSEARVEDLCTDVEAVDDSLTKYIHYLRGLNRNDHWGSE